MTYAFTIFQGYFFFFKYLYTAILVKVVSEQSGKVEYEREKLAGSDDEKYTKNLVSKDT